MLKDWITLNDQDYRLEINWNTIEDYLERKQMSLSDLSNIGDFKGEDVTLMIECAIAEGERLEGRESPVKAKDIGAVLDFDDIKDFIKIFTRRFAPDAKPEGEKTAKKKPLFSRK